MKFFDDVLDVVELAPVDVISGEVFVKVFLIDLVFVLRAYLASLWHFPFRLSVSWQIHSVIHIWLSLPVHSCFSSSCLILYTYITWLYTNSNTITRSPSLHSFFLIASEFKEICWQELYQETKWDQDTFGLRSISTIEISYPWVYPPYGQRIVYQETKWDQDIINIDWD